MLWNLAFIFLLGIILGRICIKLKIPALVGYLIAGLLLGDVSNVLSSDFLALSSDLRRFALIVILLRAGLALDLTELKKVGRPAIMLCFVPACFEILGCTLLAPMLLDLSYLEGALLGSVIAAVSPAVVVPRMLNLIEKKLGTEHAIPQMILAGASVDDVFVLVMFSAFCTMIQGGNFSPAVLLDIPISIILGIIFGIIIGVLLIAIFKHTNLSNILMLIILLSVGFLCMSLEDISPVPFSGMLSVMTIGIVIFRKTPDIAKSISLPLGNVWVFAEIILFVLVGAAVELSYIVMFGISAVIMLIGALLFRMVGVGISVTKTALTRKERLFSMIAYCPKATVQAAIGSVPLSLGFACGHTVLTAAVLAILITAPFGAFLIDTLSERLLKNS